MAVNQQFIADQLKLSRATVSRSLNNVPGIDAGTRGRVLELASKLGYRYATGGRASKRKRSHGRPVGVLIYNRREFGHGRYVDVGEGLLAGVSEAIGEYEVSLDVRYVPPAEAEKLLDVEAQPRGLREGEWQGALLVYPFPHAVVRELVRQTSCVSLVNHYEGLGIDCVDADQTLAIIKLVRQLYELGHRRIGFISSTAGHLTGWSYTRYAAYFQALARFGLVFDPHWSLSAPNQPRMQSSEQAARVAELMKEGVTGWVCAADHQGYEVLHYLKELGIRVPEDVSLSGFDGIAPPPGLPPLTSAAPPLREMGMAALRRLMSRIRRPAAPVRHTLLECSVVVGSTTAAPRASVR